MQLLIGLIIGFLVGKYLSNRTSILDINSKRQKAKEDSLNKIMGLFGHFEEISNDQVEKMLKVTDTTATNYLNELEDQGRIERIGSGGRFVRYKKK